MTHAEQSLLERMVEWKLERRILNREKQRIQRRIDELSDILKAFAK